jgi:hypothetical protein
MDLTLLAGGSASTNWITGGDITLKQSWKNFDGLLIYYTYDDKTCLRSTILYKWQLIKELELAKLTGYNTISLHTNATYWRLDAVNTTDTILKYSTDNCGIQAIYGFALKATPTIINDKALNLSDISSKIDGLLTVDGHLILPSGLEIW